MALAVALGCAFEPSLDAPGGGKGEDPGETTGEAIELQLLTVSDWHGQLDPLSLPMIGNVGGAAILSTYFERERAQNPNTLTLTAGDAFGASPPLASFFDEEPAVRALNLLKIDADTLGNHNFDKGVEHLQRMIELSDYPYVSANLENVAENLACGETSADQYAAPEPIPCVRPYLIKDVAGVKVAIIGATNPDAPGLLKPGSMGTLEVADPAVAALAARSQAAREGAQVFVLLVHMGATARDAAGEPTGPLIDLANHLSGFDVIVADHTNAPVNTIINGALVVENSSFGATYARITLQVDSETGRVLDRRAVIVTPVDHELDGTAIPGDPAIVELLAPYREELAQAFDGTIAVTDGVFERGNNIERLREVPLGNLVTDAMRARYQTQLAFTNGGGLRAALPSSYVPKDTTLRRPSTGFAAGPPYDLVVGDVFTVLPFGNSTVTRTVTGEQLWAMMEHSVAALPAANGRFGQISGFRVKFDSTKASGERVWSIALDDGTPVAKDETTYTLATSDFIDVGGDGYTMLAGNGGGVSREKLADVLLDYLKERGTLTPAVDGRIVDEPAPVGP